MSISPGSGFNVEYEPSIQISAGNPSSENLSKNALNRSQLDIVFFHCLEKVERKSHPSCQQLCRESLLDILVQIPFIFSLHLYPRVLNFQISRRMRKQMKRS